MLDEQAFRSTMVDIARSIVGLSAAPATRDAYLDLVGPGESAATQRAMTTAQTKAGPGMSGCALVVRGVLRRAGIRHPRLAPPYVVGAAVADLAHIARVGPIAANAKLSQGAWCPAPAEPRPGDIFIISNPEHVGIIVDVEDHTPTGEQLARHQVCSVDGGQRDAQGWQLVKHRERDWLYLPKRGALPARTRVFSPTESAERMLVAVIDTWRVYKAFGSDA